MAKALSVDLRQRVIAAIDGGLSCRQAAEHFGVSAASAIRWHSRSKKLATSPLNARAETADRSASKHTHN